MRNLHDKYIALVLELYNALLNASGSAPSTPRFVDDVEDGPYFLSDIEWANSINPMLVTMCKVIECSKLPSQVGVFRAVRVPELQFQSGPASRRTSLRMHRTNGHQTVELVSVSCDWDSMPFVRNGEFTYSVSRRRASTTFANWLSQDLFFLEADVNDAGQLVWGKLDPEAMRDCVTRQYSYSVDEFIRICRNTIAAHLSPRGKGKRRLLGEIVAEGPYWFRWYAKLLTYALAQDILFGLISPRHKSKKLRQIAGDEMFAVNIAGKVGTVGGLPGNRFEHVPQRLHVHGPRRAGCQAQ